MKIIKIQGGLGNQLFQYAYGRSLELSGIKIVFDISFFAGRKASIDTSRDFKLDNFNLQTKALFVNKKLSLLNLLKKCFGKLGFHKERFYQSEKYFKNCAENIRKEFTLAKPLSPASLEMSQRIMRTPQSISLHIRRGDYVLDNNTNAYHGVCGAEYYTKALDLLRSKVGPKFNQQDAAIFVFCEFSEDIAWAKTNIAFPCPVHFVSRPEIPDFEEICLMSLCKHNIVANSSFSWWGAWLNANQGKIVIAPARWFAKKQPAEADIVSSSWLRV